MSPRILHDKLENYVHDVSPIDVSMVDRAVGMARRRRRRRFIAAPVLAVLAVVLAAPLVLPGAGSLSPARGSGASLPTQVEDHSFLTADSTEHPAGPAAAVVEYWVFDDPVTVVVGAGENTYRRIRDVTGFAPNATLLSPDGGTLAYGVQKGVEVQDLRAGTRRQIPVPGSCCGVTTLAFSPDGTTIVAGATDPMGTEVLPPGIQSTPQLIDLRTGAVTPLAGKAGNRASFTPDGSLIAVSKPGLISLYDRAGKLLRDVKISGEIAGTSAFSPDGRFIATVVDVNNRSKPSTLQFVATDPGTPAGAVPPPVTIDRFDRLLGWRSNDVLIATQWGEDVQTITAVELRSGRARVLVRSPVSVDAIAPGLLRTMTIRDGGGADFGPWPGWFRAVVIAAVAVAGAVYLLVLWLFRRRARRRALEA